MFALYSTSEYYVKVCRATHNDPKLPTLERETVESRAPCAHESSLYCTSHLLLLILAVLLRTTFLILRGMLSAVPPLQGNNGIPN